MGGLINNPKEIMPFVMPHFYTIIRTSPLIPPQFIYLKKNLINKNILIRDWKKFLALSN